MWGSLWECIQNVHHLNAPHSHSIVTGCGYIKKMLRSEWSRGMKTVLKENIGVAIIHLLLYRVGGGANTLWTCFVKYVLDMFLG